MVDPGPCLSAVFVECAVTYSYLPFSSGATEIADESLLQCAARIQIWHLSKSTHFNINLARTRQTTYPNAKLNPRDTGIANASQWSDRSLSQRKNAIFSIAMRRRSRWAAAKMNSLRNVNIYSQLGYCSRCAARSNFSKTNMINLKLGRSALSLYDCIILFPR